LRWQLVDLNDEKRKGKKTRVKTKIKSKLYLFD
jgi:hypothetical protein